MKKYLKFVSPLISLLVFFMLLTFKTIPSGKLWKGYNVLYVPVETSDSLVLNVFKDLEISEHFELSGQYLPLTFAALSPEVTLLKLNSSDSTFQYLNQRNAYFFDKSNKFRLYYISSDNKNKLDSCLKMLAKQDVKAGVDGSSSYPFLIPVISLVLFIVLLICAKNKLVFGFSGLLLIEFIFCNPFYSCGVAFCLFMLCIFFMANVWKRKDFIIYLVSNFAIPAMLFFSLLGAFAGSIKSGFMFLITVIGIFAAVYSIFNFEQMIINKRSFIPVLIRPAKRVSIYAGKFNQTLISSICAVLFLIGISFVSSSTSVNAKYGKLVLPASEANSSDLVTLDDYYDFVWNVSSYPYKNLNNKNENNYFEYPRYEESNGIIVEKKQIKAFNESFKLETYDSIDSLQFNAVEKLLKSQGSEVKPGYISSSSYHTGIFAIIVMFISLSILLFIYISSIIKKGVRK